MTTVLASVGARRPSRPAAVLLTLLALLALAAYLAPYAGASPTVPTAPGARPTAPSVTVDLGTAGDKPGSSLVVILLITALSVAPALLLLCTSFTKIIIVLGITRNALGLATTPPNQVLAGLALFLSLFVMGPVLSQVNDTGVQPYLKGDKSLSQAFETGTTPLKEFMLEQTRPEDLALMTKAAQRELPKDRADVDLVTLVPSFVLSELRSAFLIGFVVFVPFLVIDIVVSAALMSMGMMMLPPVTVSLPFKLLLFVLVDGWGLVLTALIGSYR